MAAIPVVKQPAGEALSRFVGKSIDEICPVHFGSDGDAHNHCSHFVSHALSIAVGLTCRGMFHQAVLKKQGLGDKPGATLRVNDLYASVSGEVRDSFKDDDSGLIFVTKKSNYDAKTDVMGSARAKHVGIIDKGTVWHYADTIDAIRADPTKTFMEMFIDHPSYGNGKAETLVFAFASVPLSNIGSPLPTTTDV